MIDDARWCEAVKLLPPWTRARVFVSSGIVELEFDRAATKSPIESPPNFSHAARASSKATQASATTASASTAHTSERSTRA